MLNMYIKLQENSFSGFEDVTWNPNSKGDTSLRQCDLCFNVLFSFSFLKRCTNEVAANVYELHVFS